LHPSDWIVPEIGMLLGTVNGSVIGFILGFVGSATLNSFFVVTGGLIGFFYQLIFLKVFAALEHEATYIKKRECMSFVLESGWLAAA